MPNFKQFILCALAIWTPFFQACKEDDAPEEEPDVELITDVRLIFNPLEGAPGVFLASDPDGDGPEDLQSESPITLKGHTTYQLFIEFQNSIAGTDVTGEIETEGNEHQIFFGFTPDFFLYPAGDGNIDGPAIEGEAIRYEDMDANGLPIGLISSWRTGSSDAGEFRIVLKHQPGKKSETSDFSTGSTDVDVIWELSVE